MSPRKGPARPVLAFRLSAETIAWLDDRAREEGLNRSQVLRLLLRYAMVQMPKGWKPTARNV